MDRQAERERMRKELHHGQRLLNHVCLYKSAIWAGELLEDIADRTRQRDSGFGQECPFECDVHYTLGSDLLNEMVTFKEGGLV